MASQYLNFSYAIRKIDAAPVRWLYPTLSTLDFSTDCELAAPFFRTWSNGDDDRGVWSAVVPYFKNALPANATPDIWLTDGIIMDWFIFAQLNGSVQKGQVSDTFSVYVLRKPFEKCQNEICKAFSWSGNPDISGVGVFASYIMQLILLSAVMLGFVLRQRRGSPRKNRGFLDRFIAATTETLSTFLESVILLAISIEAATLNIFRHAATNDVVTKQDNIFGVVLAEFSTMSAITVCFFTKLDGFKWTAKRTFAIVFPVFLVVMLYVIMYMPASTQTSRNELWCMPTGVKQWLRPLTDLGVAATICTIALPILGSGSSSKLARYFNTTEERVVLFLKWSYLALSYAFTWVMFGFLAWHRQRYLDRFGEDNEETAWGFGQILAMFIWGPLVFQMGMIFYYGESSDAQPNETPTDNVAAQSRTV